MIELIIIILDKSRFHKLGKDLNSNFHFLNCNVLLVLLTPWGLKVLWLCDQHFDLSVFDNCIGIIAHKHDTWGYKFNGVNGLIKCYLSFVSPTFH